MTGSQRTETEALSVEYWIGQNMNFCNLATDYDGTLADNGRVSKSTIQALEAFRGSGRSITLVTGRELPQLLEIFDRTDLFEWIVAENGALLYHPATGRKRLLAEPISLQFVEELQRRGVSPISTGDVVVATWRPHENTVVEVIRNLGLELQVTLNKDAVMVLPIGVDKASGLAAALEEMRLSWRNVVGVGDAENDIAFLRKCECSVAVSNALDSVKAQADFTTSAAREQGVVELIGEILKDDLQSRLLMQREGPMTASF
jgi:HAD superfamily hydrolase (TIGR01484 family)